MQENTKPSRSLFSQDGQLNRGSNPRFNHRVFGIDMQVPPTWCTLTVSRRDALSG